MVHAHDRLFGGGLTGSLLVGELKSICYLGDDVALAYTTGSMLVRVFPALTVRQMVRIADVLNLGAITAQIGR